MSRNLASIQKILALEPIEGKDKIVLATVLGWKCIVQKDEFKVGDFCVYIEIDSILPERPEFEFLRKRCFSEKKGGFHIKTLKMGGVISQGIVFPLSVVPFNTYSSAGLSGYREGDDVTELLDIHKWDPEINDPAPRNISHKNPIINYMLRWKWFRNWLYPPTPAWPEWIPHTDETRLQALGDTWLHENFLGKEMVITEKVDGQSCTFAYVNKTFYVCSRNRVIWKGPLAKLRKADSTWLRFAVENQVDKKIRSLSKRYNADMFIQGELAGPGIQGNKYKFEKLRFFAFNFFVAGWKQGYGFWPVNLTPLGRNMIAPTSNFPFETVPVVGNITIRNNDTVDSFMKMSTAESVFGNTLREGIVIRPLNLEKGRDGTGPVLGFKCVSPEFLLAHDL